MCSAEKTIVLFRTGFRDDNLKRRRKAVYHQSLFSTGLLSLPLYYNRGTQTLPICALILLTGEKCSAS